MGKGTIEMREIKSGKGILLEEIEFTKNKKEQAIQFEHLPRILLGNELFDHIVEGPNYHGNEYLV